MTAQPAVKTLEIYSDTRGKSRCKSCDARIEWAQIVASGKRMPFDGEIVPVGSRHETETHRLVEIVDLDVTTSHFANCPQSEQWGRR